MVCVACGIPGTSKYVVNNLYMGSYPTLHSFQLPQSQPGYPCRLYGIHNKSRKPGILQSLFGSTGMQKSCFFIWKDDTINFMGENSWTSTFTKTYKFLDPISIVAKTKRVPKIAPATTGGPSGLPSPRANARDPHSAHNILQGMTLTRCRVSCIWHETNFKKETSKTGKTKWNSSAFVFRKQQLDAEKKQRKKTTSNKIITRFESP